MRRLDLEDDEIQQVVAHEHLAGGEGLVFLGVLAGSWAIAIGVGWVIWRVAPI